MLHPMSGKIFYGSWYEESDAELYMYRGWCLALYGETSTSGADTRLEVCSDYEEGLEDAYNEERFKYGYNWYTGKFEADNEQITLADAPWSVRAHYCNHEHAVQLRLN